LLIFACRKRALSSDSDTDDDVEPDERKLPPLPCLPGPPSSDCQVPPVQAGSSHRPDRPDPVVAPPVQSGSSRRTDPVVAPPVQAGSSRRTDPVVAPPVQAGSSRPTDPVVAPPVQAGSSRPTDPVVAPPVQAGSSRPTDPVVAPPVQSGSSRRTDPVVAPPVQAGSSRRTDPVVAPPVQAGSSRRTDPVVAPPVQSNRMLFTVLEELKLQNNAQQQLNNMAAMMQLLVGKFGGVEEATLQLPDNISLPCATLQDLQDLDGQMSNQTIRTNVVCNYASVLFVGICFMKYP